MSRQLELDINRPAWHETDYRTEVSNLWNVRRDKTATRKDLDEEFKSDFAVYPETTNEDKVQNK